MKAITEYMLLPNGGRNRSFDVRGCRVLIEPPSGEKDIIAAEVARQLAAAADGLELHHADLEARLVAAEERARIAEARVAKLEARVPPPTPVRMLGPGCVRFDEQGRLWLLNKRESGWASWGVICDGWDDLFRRYAVVITATGKDEHGLWWIAEPYTKGGAIES